MEGSHFVFWWIIGGAVVVVGKGLVMMSCGLRQGGGGTQGVCGFKIRGRSWRMKMEGAMGVVFKRDIFVCGGVRGGTLF